MTDPNTNPTPPTEPKASEQLTGFWASLSKNAKIAIVAVAVVLVIAIASSGGNGNNGNNTGGGNGGGGTTETTYVPTTQSPSAAYSDWKSSFAPIFAGVISDYQQTQTDLSNADMASSRVDFVTLSQDAIDMSSNANSPDDRVNAAVSQFSADLGVLAGEGEQSLNNIDAGGNPTPGFSTACDAISNDIAELNAALTAANGTY